MNEPQEALSEQARAVIAEEEALLARVLGAIQSVRQRSGRGQDRGDLLERLTTLRDEASTAVESDLPALFQQLDNTRALLERDETVHLPDPHTPYFAHLRLKRYESTPQEYLLGRTTFTDAASGVRVIDWRYAPIARVFYGYEEGDDYEEYFGDRLSEGIVEARRLVVIERGVLTRIRAGSLHLERTAAGEWREVGATSTLSGGAGTAVRAGSLGVGTGEEGRAGRFDVTAQLDSEQFEALQVGADQPLLVLGSAGSGKTTVALHRLAKLTFDLRARSLPSKMKVVVPEEGLARLSKRLLAPLELRNVSVETLDAWAYATACTAFGVKSIALSPDKPALTARLKRHPALRPVLEKRLHLSKKTEPNFKRLRKRLAELLTDRTVLAEVVAASKGDLPLPAIDDTVRHTMLQLATPLAQEFEGYHPESLQTVDGLALEESTPDALANTVDVEDLPLLLFLKARYGHLGTEPLAHAVLDEAEDFSLFELSVMGQQLGKTRSCTLAGDEMQQTTTSFAGWPAALAELGIKDAATVRLSVSYRCPRPVIELARHVLGPMAPEAPPKNAREGVPVGFHHFPEEAQAWLFVRDALKDLLEREPRASVAVIASSPEAARAFHKVVDDMPAVRLVLEGDFSFEPGVDVTDVESIKGLEFDYVILPDATARAWPQSDETRRKLHVAITRASHQLWVISSGVRSRLLPAPQA
ncbi:ATP-binding domain-containing protein [Hyalangium rubrum]|uniref:DNA 3'-5' helicase II n=1 Tax=Hyalangium rubrum TaxID=3103134 RepID=A0ABU5H9J2_9BACT|nr:ATP-binding domain-containing protein [Hyalangium sp. s54d21]MDY7230149.1 ATP-binding domain-containing protein [Hyalangium sp. s54d21]